MGKPELGKRHRCFECGCAFYDLRKTKAICPRCGADQSRAPKFEIPVEPKVPKAKEKVLIPPLEEVDALPEDLDEFHEVLIDEEVPFTEAEEEEEEE